MAVELLALQQPMARDLRFIIAAIKVTSDLERVGDHAVNIAQSAQRLIASKSTITPDPEIEDMARRARRCSATRSTPSCAPTARSDATCAARRRGGRAARVGVPHPPDAHDGGSRTTISMALELLLVSRNLERVADLATNIGEDAVFLAEGKQIKHHLEDRPRR